jgi:hypothetical protein
MIVDASEVIQLDAERMTDFLLDPDKELFEIDNFCSSLVSN